MRRIFLLITLIISSAIFNKLSAQDNIDINYPTVSKTPPPLFIVDGKELDSFKLGDIKPDDIESMSVFKGDDAINKYGSKGKKGVIEITTKKSIKSTTKSEIKLNSKVKAITDPLFILDGVEISKADLEKVDKDNIEKMVVIKDKKAIEKYGEKGKNGVVVIYSKK